MNQFADVFPERAVQHLRTIYLVSNRIERLASDAFAGFPQLRNLHIESNPIKCDCQTQQLFKDLRAIDVHPKIGCASVMGANSPNFVLTVSNIRHFDNDCGMYSWNTH